MLTFNRLKPTLKLNSFLLNRPQQQQQDGQTNVPHSQSPTTTTTLPNSMSSSNYNCNYTQSGSGGQYQNWSSSHSMSNYFPYYYFPYYCQQQQPEQQQQQLLAQRQQHFQQQGTNSIEKNFSLKNGFRFNQDSATFENQFSPWVESQANKGASINDVCTRGGRGGNGKWNEVGCVKIQTKEGRG